MPLLTRTGVFARCLLSALCLALLSGCAGVTVKSMDPAQYLAQRRSDALTDKTLSMASQEALRVLGLEAHTCQDNAGACEQALLTATGLYDEQRMATLSELWLSQARSMQASATQSPAPSAALLQAWMQSARYAWAYLFFTTRTPGQRAFEDRQTQVRDYYNYAVQQAIIGLLASDAQASSSAPIARSLGNWRMQVDVSGITLPSQHYGLQEILPASSLRFSGLRNQYRREGFGAELVAVFQPRDLSGAADASQNLSPFQEDLFPTITGLMHFEGERLQDVLTTQNVRLQILDPYRFAQVQLGDTEVPLAGNFTAGYGLWLARSDFAPQALRTLAGLSQGITHPKIYLMQPYDPNRRILLMLHGLASSPEAWINVANEVLGDEKLRRNYQVWQVYYPTNAPLALNQYTIRQTLEVTLQHFDPQGSSRASRDITLVGHSMGGVLSRLMVSQTHGQLWQQLTDTYGIAADHDPQLRAKLAPFVELTPVPQVSSAIFIAAPHRGTDFASNRVARWASNLIQLPFAMVAQLADATASLAHAAPRMGKQPLLRVPNSIDNLSDQDPYVQITSQLAISPDVRYHTIVGNNGASADLAASTDGVVPYASAHLPGAASELVVPSGHSVQEHPQAIVEIRRILHQQLQPNTPSASAAYSTSTPTPAPASTSVATHATPRPGAMAARTALSPSP